MKKILVLFVIAATMLVSCGKEKTASTGVTDEPKTGVSSSPDAEDNLNVKDLHEVVEHE
jgi:hypothetical protein